MDDCISNEDEELPRKIDLSKFAFGRKRTIDEVDDRKPETEDHASLLSTLSASKGARSVVKSPAKSSAPQKKAAGLQNVRLPDYIRPDLDILIVGFNPGCNSASHGHHYAGPGNHFWKCLSRSGLVSENLTFHDDIRIMDFGIGLTNIVARPSVSTSDLTKAELHRGAEELRQKIKHFRPRIVCFNGIGIYEVYSGSKDFKLGLQSGTLPGTSALGFVMPSSSPRGTKWPRLEDKLPFYVGLKLMRDYICRGAEKPAENLVVFAK